MQPCQPCVRPSPAERWPVDRMAAQSLRSISSSSYGDERLEPDALMSTRSKRFLMIAAWSCIVSWGAWAGLIGLRMASAVRGNIPAWLGPNALPELAINVVCVLAMLICWLGSIVVWAKSGRRGILHSALLPILLFFGAIVGAFYILVALRSVPGVKAGEVAA